jgi:uroporphyrinogen III methyltransferase/synthase
VGQVATLREHIAWFESRPLFGKRVLVTRTRHQASALADLLRREGAQPIELPTLELAPVAGDPDLEAHAERLDRSEYAWCLFTSTNAVEHFFAFLERSGRDARAFGGCRIASLGSATSAALQRRGLRPDLVAGEYSSEGLADALAAVELSGARLLLPRAEGGSPELVRALTARGASVDELVLYESRPPAVADPEVVQLLREGKVDVATFASSSSIRNLATLLGADFKRLEAMLVACIGPVTAQTAREHGIEVAIEPAEHTIPALVEALKTHYRR